MPPRRKGQIMDELAGGPVLNEKFAWKTVDRARAEGVNLVGPSGLLGGLTKQVLETALEAPGTQGRRGDPFPTVLRRVGDPGAFHCDDSDFGDSNMKGSTGFAARRSRWRCT